MTDDKACIIYVFSGTGNSELVAEEYARNLSMRTEVVAITARYDKLPSPDSYSLVGIGYPVHAFNSPLIVHAFAKKLKCTEKKNLFIFHTGGEGLPFNESSSIAIRNILRKNFNIISERHFVMPYNMIFRHSDEMVKHMVTYMKKLVRIHTEEIRDGKKERKRHMPFRHLISIILRIEWIYALKQARTMKVSDNCISCGECSKNCPMENIRMENGKPVFSEHCTLCVRCSFYCPTGAISIGLLERWKVNGPYKFEDIENNESINDEIAIKDLPFLYRGYYKRAARTIIENDRNKKQESS